MTHQDLVVVTGGASGIGHAIARRFTRAGHPVLVADINADAAATVAAELGPQALARAVDVADDGAVADFVAEVESNAGAIAVLVNSAGLLQNQTTVAAGDMGEHDRIWAVNYRGTYLMCRAVGPRMAGRGGGAILNIASINAYTPLPLPAYNPTKVAVDGLTRLLAAEWGAQGVRVNAVAPGFTRTPALQARIDSGHRNEAGMAALSTLRRLVTPDEVAEAAYFLCSPAASAITGVDLPIDCGYMAAISYNSYPSS